MRPSPNAPRQSEGSTLLVALFFLTAMAAYTSVGLTRSMTELRAANQSVDDQRAFHIAEAGIDGYLHLLRSSVAGTVNQLLSSLPKQNVPCDVPHCTILEVKDDADDADPARDSNKIIVMRVRGTANNISHTIQATLYVDTSNPTVYPYSVAGKTINMDGNSTFGDPTEWNKTVIYAQGPPDANGSFLSTSTNQVWAGRIAFYNPTSASLVALCPNCTNQSIFHPEPFTGQLTTFDTNAPQAPDLKIDLKPYYDEAVMEGHVISATPAQPFKNTTLNGVYYVECGVSIKFSGTVTVNGSIVHEGCGGTIELLSNADLTLDSLAGTNPFAPGMAIVGAPTLLFKETALMNITGLVMGRGGDVTNMKAHGTIHGSLLAVEDAGASHPDLVSGPGPGSNSMITFPLSQLRVENAQIVFAAISGNDPPPVTSGVIATLRAWIQEN